MAWRGLAAALAAAGVIAPTSTLAQSPGPVPAAKSPAMTAPVDGPLPQTMPASPCAGTAAGLADALASDGANWPFLFYARGGVVESLGTDQISKRLSTGWAIQAGVEQKISCANPWLEIFVDFGAGYTEAPGTESQEPRRTSGHIVAPRPPDNNPQFSQDFFFTRIGRFRRSDLHAAIDSHFFPPLWQTREDRNFSVNFRAGARVSAIGISYDQQPTPTLQNTITNLISPDHFGPGAGGQDPRALLFLSDARKTDYAFGLFASLGGGWTYHDVPFGLFTFSTVELAAEAEFSHDWINAGQFTKGKKSLWLVTPLVSLNFAF